MEKAIIAAVSENGVIGYGGKMPWHIPEDMKHFYDLTLGCPIIMGRKTQQSIGKILPDRLNIVVSRDETFSPSNEKIVVCHSIEEAVKLAEGFNEFATGYLPRLYFIGGREIYQQAMPLADRLEMTWVHQNVEGDTYFPDIDGSWKEVSRRDFQTKKGIPISFVSSVRR